MNNNVKVGAGFFDLLLIAFIVMKLCGTITWSWWWVLSPFWIPVSLVFLALVIYGVAMAYLTNGERK